MRESSRSLQLHHLFPVLSEQESCVSDGIELSETERELLRMSNGKVSLAELPLLMNLSVSETMRCIRNLIASERIELRRLYSSSLQDDGESEDGTDSKEGLQYHFPVDGDISPAEATERLLESLSSSELLLAEDGELSPISVSAVSGHPKEVPQLSQRHPSSPSNPVDATLAEVPLNSSDSLVESCAEENAYVVEPTASLPVLDQVSLHQDCWAQGGEQDHFVSEGQKLPSPFHTLEPLHAVPPVETFLQMESEIATQEELPASSEELLEQTEWERPSLSMLNSDEFEDTSPEEQKSLLSPTSRKPPMFEPTVAEVPVIGFKPAAKVVVEPKSSAWSSLSERVGLSLRPTSKSSLHASNPTPAPPTRRKQRNRSEPALFPSSLKRPKARVVVVRGNRKS